MVEIVSINTDPPCGGIDADLTRSFQDSASFVGMECSQESNTTYRKGSGSEAVTLMCETLKLKNKINGAFGYHGRVKRRCFTVGSLWNPWAHLRELCCV